MAEAAEEKKPGGRPQESLTESAYHIIRSRILQGLFPPEEALLEEQLSVALGMSRTPVRTALTKLKSENLLVEGADRALHTPRLDRKGLRDTFAARIAVEATIAEIAATAAAEGQVRNLEHLVWSESAASAKKDEPLAAGLDRMFHGYLAEITGNQDLIDFSDRLNAKTALMLSQAKLANDSVIPYSDEHNRILEKIRARDAAGAAGAMRQHLENVCERIEGHLAAKNGGWPDERTRGG